MTKQRFCFYGAVYVFFIREGQVLLLRRFNTGYEDGNYSVVAGHLEGNEEIKCGAIREAQEEAGVSILPEDLEIVGVMHRKTDTREYIDFFLVAKKWAGEIVNAEPDKCDQLEWFHMNDLPDNVIPYVKQAINNYRNGNWFASYGWN